MTLPLASPAGYAGPAGRRPPPLRIVWAALRNVRMLFSGAGPSSLPAEKEAEKVAAQRMMDATSRVAKSAVDVRPSSPVPTRTAPVHAAGTYKRRLTLGCRGR